MMISEEEIFEKRLNSKLNEATSLSNKAINIEAINEFCHLVRSQNDGSRFAIVLISKKLNSEEEWEIMQTLNVLKLGAEKCGASFQKEIGMFRFLNNLIKLIFPKYLGNLTSEKVKIEICKILHEWSHTIDQPKIKEAFEMLKQQNFIPKSLGYTCDASKTIEKSRPLNSLNMDETTSKKLSRLLKSTSPEDLEQANILIKSLVKEDELKTQRKITRSSELEFIQSNVLLLKEMLNNISMQHSQQLNLPDMELMQEFYSTCASKKDKLVQLVEEIDNDSEDLIGDIVQIHEDLCQCLQKYTDFVARPEITSHLTNSNGPILNSNNTINDIDKNHINDCSTTSTNILSNPPPIDRKTKPINITAPSPEILTRKPIQLNAKYDSNEEELLDMTNLNISAPLSLNSETTDTNSHLLDFNPSLLLPYENCISSENEEHGAEPDTKKEGFDISERVAPINASPQSTIADELGYVSSEPTLADELGDIFGDKPVNQPKNLKTRKNSVEPDLLLDGYADNVDNNFTGDQDDNFLLSSIDFTLPKEQLCLHDGSIKAYSVSATPMPATTLHSPSNNYPKSTHSASSILPRPDQSNYLNKPGFFNNLKSNIRHNHNDTSSNKFSNFKNVKNSTGALADLDTLAKKILVQSLQSKQTTPSTELVSKNNEMLVTKLVPNNEINLKDLRKDETAPSTSSDFDKAALLATKNDKGSMVTDFTNFKVAMSELTPDATFSPLTLYDKDQLKIVLSKTIAKSSPCFDQEKLNKIYIYSLLFISINPNPIETIQCVVSATSTQFKVLTKVEPNSEFNLEAFNPFLPPPSKPILLYMAKQSDNSNQKTDGLCENNFVNLNIDLTYVIKGSKSNTSIILPNSLQL